MSKYKALNELTNSKGKVIANAGDIIDLDDGEVVHGGIQLLVKTMSEKATVEEIKKLIEDKFEIEEKLKILNNDLKKIKESKKVDKKVEARVNFGKELTSVGLSPNRVKLVLEKFNTREELMRGLKKKLPLDDEANEKLKTYYKGVK